MSTGIHVVDRLDRARDPYSGPSLKGSVQWAVFKGIRIEDRLDRDPYSGPSLKGSV